MNVDLYDQSGNRYQESNGLIYKINQTKPEGYVVGDWAIMRNSDRIHLPSANGANIWKNSEEIKSYSGGSSYGSSPASSTMADIKPEYVGRASSNPFSSSMADISSSSYNNSYSDIRSENIVGEALVGLAEVLEFGGKATYLGVKGIVKGAEWVGKRFINNCKDIASECKEFEQTKEMERNVAIHNLDINARKEGKSGIAMYSGYGFNEILYNSKNFDQFSCISLYNKKRELIYKLYSNGKLVKNNKNYFIREDGTIIDKHNKEVGKHFGLCQFKTSK